VVYALAKDFLIFDFATYYVNTHDSIHSFEDFKLSDKDFDDFMAFVEQSGFSYSSNASKMLLKMKEDEDIKNSEELMAKIELLEKELEIQNTRQITDNKEVLKNLIRQEIISRYYFAEGKIKAALDSDKEMDAVINLLEDNKTYQSILNP